MIKTTTLALRSPLRMKQALSMADPVINLTDLCLQTLLPKQQNHFMHLVNSWSAHGLYLKLQTYHSKPFSHVFRESF